MKLTHQNVEKVVKDCLYKDDEFKDLKFGEVPEGCKMVVGLVGQFGFHPDRLESNYDNVVSMLNQLPVVFREEYEEGGMSFLQACKDKDGRQWTGEHRTMENLFLLGMVLGRVKYTFPRTMWKVLPGGVPYFMITKERFDYMDPKTFDNHIGESFMKWVAEHKTEKKQTDGRIHRVKGPEREQ